MISRAIGHVLYANYCGRWLVGARLEMIDVEDRLIPIPSTGTQVIVKFPGMKDESKDEPEGQPEDAEDNIQIYCGCVIDRSPTTDPSYNVSMIIGEPPAAT